MSPRSTHRSTDRTFGVLLKQLRRRAGMTQGDLAAALGYSIALISSLEKAQRRPDLQAVTERFIPALGLQDDPHLAASLIEQAALARGERPPAAITFQHTTQMTWHEERTVTNTHLPAPPTLLIGRTAEVTHLCNRLLGHSGRLLTLVGPPGVGKTTLALAAATQVQHHYRDGAHFIALAAASDPLVMATTIIGVVAPGDTSAKPPESRLIELLRQRAVLLVLDNLEQLLSPPLSGEGSGVGLIAAILAECPAVTILATSCERLHLRAEQRFKVLPLELPAAMELFVQRAQAVDTAFKAVAEQEAVIAAICQRLDCLPLALELCAAQIDLRSLYQLLAQLQDHSLDLLVAGSHDSPPHQHTLRTAIEHSYRLLSEDERILFRRLGVFIGGFDLAAAAAVAGEDQETGTQRLLATLHALIGKSLVRSEPFPNGEQRLRLLETLRDYACEQLASSGEHNEIHRRHAHYFHELAVPPDEATTSKILNPKFANLPSQSTPFIGRSVELGQIAKLLVNPECRLITLLGPGGSGKTRLAIEVAQQQVNCYPQGVYFVSLAPIAAIEHAIPAMAESLQFRFQNDGRSPQVQLCDYLSNKQLLLILDNFEHLIEGATLVHELLQSSPGLKCMVTSRERLQLHSETIFVVGSLSFPRDNSTRNVTEYDAIELFVKTARRVYSRFQLDEHCQAVIQICQLVGGMPLGVILAASWVGIIAPTEIAAELVKGFQFLEVDLQDLPVRQRNMRVMLAYSWQRLTEVERETFMQLAIFRGGFTRSAAQTVSGASLPILARLIDKSFVQRIREDWYELHELLRQYGAEQLSLKPELERSARDRHSAYYCHLLQHQKNRLKNSDHQLALEEIEANLQNIRTAWQWAVEHEQFERLIEAQESLNRFFDYMGMIQEGEKVCHQTIVSLDRSTTSTDLRLLAQLLTWQGVFNRKSGNIIRGEQLFQQSLVILNGSKLLEEDVSAERAFLFLLMGGIDREKSITFRLQSLALYRSIGDKWGTAIALEYLGGAYQMQGDLTRADECLRESLQIREDIEYHIGIAVSLRALGLSAMDRGDYEQAEKLVRRGLDIIQPSRNYYEISRILHPLGTVLLRAGKYSESISVIEDFWAIRAEQNGMKESLHIFPSLSDAILHIGQYSQASALLAPLLVNARKIDNHFGIGHCLITLAMLSLTTEDFVQAQCMVEESMILWEQYGYRLFMGHALALLGIAACKQNDFLLAQEALTEAVKIGITQSIILPLTYALPGIALFYTKQNEDERAIEIYTSALCHPHVANSRWFEDVIGRYVVNASQRLSTEMVAAAQVRGQGRDLWQTATEALEQLTAT